MDSQPRGAAFGRPVAAHRPEIDGLRALAVLAVVVYHACASISTGRPQTPLEAVGARGVDLFFVLSGFCLSLPYAKGSMRTAGHAVTFFRRRITRIAPAYYVALGLFAALSLTPFGVPGIATPVSAAVALHELGRDALFFPTMLPIHDQSIWTLGVEMRWYVLFPPILLLFHRSKFGFALLAVACSWFAHSVGSPDLSALPSFMLGIVAAELTKNNYRFNRIWPFAAVVLLALAIDEQMHSLAIDHASVLWSLACFAIVTAVATNAALRRIFAFGPMVAIGVASYSIYLVHLPFVNALDWAGVPDGLAAIVAIAIGGAFYALVERPLGTKRARERVEAGMLRLWHVLPIGQARPDDALRVPGV